MFAKKLRQRVADFIAPANAHVQTSDTTTPYKLATMDKRNPRNPLGRSGDSALYASHDLLHRRTRDMYLNNAVFKRLIDVLRDLAVGTGINAFADPIDHTFGWDLQRRPRADLDAALDYALECDEKFLRWAESPDVSVERNQNWFEIMPLCLTEPATVGTTLVVFSMRRNAEIPLTLQLVEREQLDTRQDRPAHESNGMRRVVNGIMYDQNNRELGAFVYDVHPYDAGIATGVVGSQSSFVPASRYAHLFKRHRPSQHIGGTWAHATGQTLIDRDKGVETELRKWIKQALFVLLHQSDTPGRGMGMDVDDPDLETDIALGTNPIAIDTHTNDKVEMIESKAPSERVQNFIDILDHDLTAAMNVSYYSATNRFERTNYGGFRGAMNLEDAQLRPIQYWIGQQIVLPVRRRVNQMLINFGLLDSLTPAQHARERSRFDQFDVIGPGRVLLDRQKESEGAQTELRGGLTNLKIELLRRGCHWIKVLRQRKLEVVVLDGLGLTLDHGAGGGGGSVVGGGETETETETVTDQAAGVL